MKEATGFYLRTGEDILEGDILKVNSFVTFYVLKGDGTIKYDYEFDYKALTGSYSTAWGYSGSGNESKLFLIAKSLTLGSWGYSSSEDDSNLVSIVLTL